jgi:hypothetical protein
MALKPGNHSDFGMLVLEEWDALIARYFEDSRSLAPMGLSPSTNGIPLRNISSDA